MKYRIKVVASSKQIELFLRTRHTVELGAVVEAGCAKGAVEVETSDLDLSDFAGRYMSHEEATLDILNFFD